MFSESVTFSHWFHDGYEFHHTWVLLGIFVVIVANTICMVIDTEVILRITHGVFGVFMRFFDSFVFTLFELISSDLLCLLQVFFDFSFFMTSKLMLLLIQFLFLG